MAHYMRLLEGGLQTLPGIPTKLTLMGEYMVHLDVLEGHDGTDPNRPLDLVAIGKSEQLAGGSLLSKYCRDFDENNIGEIFRMSLMEYLRLPVPYAEDIKQTAALLTKRRARLKKGVADDVNL